MTQSIKFHNAAGIVPIINDDGQIKVLLIKSSLGWEFPKGHIELGETLLQTAKREAKEETGLDIKEILPFRHVVKYLIRKNYATGEKLKIPEPKTVTYFLGKAPQKDIKLSFEHSAYGWFTLQEGFNKLSFGSKSETLQKVVSFLKSDSYIKLIYT
jgi:8-oxo-dGTP pyrophosphatase MutT (NUDIX family)